MLYFSASRDGFFDTKVHSFIPDDKVEVSTEEYQALFKGQQAGKIIVADSTGRPTLADRPQVALPEVTTHLPAEAPQPAPEDEGKAE